MQIIRVDNGPEYISGKLKAWAERVGIYIQYIQPEKPQQNAYIERYNRTVRTEWLGHSTKYLVASLPPLPDNWAFLMGLLITDLKTAKGLDLSEALNEAKRQLVEGDWTHITKGNILSFPLHDQLSDIINPKLTTTRRIWENRNIHKKTKFNSGILTSS